MTKSAKRLAVHVKRQDLVIGRWERRRLWSSAFTGLGAGTVPAKGP